MKDTLRHRTIAGFAWAATGEVGSQAIHYIAILILAWLLSPREFGLVGLAMIFMNFTLVVGELGLVQAIIQRADADEPVLSTAFWANLGASLIMAALTYFNAGLITGFLGDDRAASLLRVLSVMFPITAVGVVPNAVLRKNLKFDRLARRQLASELAFGVVGLLFALAGAGVWSLVGAITAQRVTMSALLWAMVPWRPKLTFDLRSLRQLLRFGFYAMISTFFFKGLSNLDYFVVGKWIGIEALGYYTLAHQLAISPQRHLTSMLHQVVFPAFSLVQNDLARMKAGFTEGIQHLFVVVAPLTLFLVVLGPHFIEILYNQEWLKAAVPLQILAIGGFFYCFDISWSVFYAVGRPQLGVWILVIRLALFAILVVFWGLTMGVAGVAISFSFAVALTSFGAFMMVGRFIEATRKELLKALFPALRGALYVTLFAIVSSILLPVEDLSHWIAIAGSGLAMALLYVVALIPAYGPMLKRLLAGMQRQNYR